MKHILAISLILTLRAAATPAPAPAASPYHHVRASLHLPGATMTVAYLGGSITFNPGWRDKVTAYLRERWPRTTLRFIAAGIPSLGSVPHAFRLQRDLLDSGKVDLLFVETAVNDRVNGTDSLLQVRALEGIIRHARRANPSMDIVMMAFADEDKTRDYGAYHTPAEIANQELIATHYQLPSVNIAREVADRIHSGEIDWKRDFKDVHPAEFGQELYFKSIKSLLEDCWATPRHTNIAAAALDPHNFSEGQYLPVNFAEPDSSWHIDPDWTPTDKADTRPGFVHIPMLVATTPGAALSLSFRGSAIGIAVVSGPDAGIIRYDIDGGPEKTLDLHTQWSSWLHLPWYEMLGSGFGDKPHVLRLHLDRGAVRIAHFLLNGPPATTNDAKLAAFMDLRFGMFIHWGPVTLRGTEIGWSRGREVPTAEYDTLYKEFDPVLFNADAWVSAAKAAGMRYLTIVAKHHDGFCLWPTAYSDYNIMHSPYKHDIVGELAAACRKYGLHFCIYSTILDWHDPDYGPHMPVFVQRMKNELHELITRYHPYMLWFDGYWESPWTTAYGREIYDYIKSLDPDVIVNNRLGKKMTSLTEKGAVGDFLTPEQEIGRLNMTEPWESCITIAQQWAWKPNDKVKTTKECIQTLIRTAAGNGNLLLNVSPMPDGRMEEREVTRLKEVGAWLGRNGESIYGTKGGPYVPNDVYASTRKGNKIYIHLFKATPSLTLPALPITPKRVYWLHGPDVPHDGYTINTGASGADNPVLVLEFDTGTETLPIIHD